MWGTLPPGSGDDSSGVHTRRARPWEHERRLSLASLREGPSPYHQAQFSPQTGDLRQKGWQVPRRGPCSQQLSLAELPPAPPGVQATTSLNAGSAPCRDHRMQWGAEPGPEPALGPRPPGSSHPGKGAESSRHPPLATNQPRQRREPTPA